MLRTRFIWLSLFTALGMTYLGASTFAQEIPSDYQDVLKYLGRKGDFIAKRHSPYLANYYERIRSRRGTGRAIIALARKFLGIIYRTLKNNWVFQDFPHFVLEESAT